jgi:hypothetical protein
MPAPTECRSRLVKAVLAVLAVLSAARRLGSVKGFGSGPCRYYIVLPHEVVDRMNSTSHYEIEQTEKQNTMIHVHTRQAGSCAPRS